MTETEQGEITYSASVAEEKNDTPKEMNIYPMIRTTFLVLCALIAVLVVLFLIYQNGKSIYESGI